MKKLKKARILLLAIALLAVSLVGCGKQKEPVADLNNWINGIYVADTYTEEMGTTFTEETFKANKQDIHDAVEKELLGDIINPLKQQIASLGVENAEQEAEKLMIKLKDAIVVSMLQAYKDIEYTVEEVSKDSEKATLKVTSAPINADDTMVNIMTAFAESVPADIDPELLTAEKAIETLDKMIIEPMISAYQDGFANPIYSEKQEVLIDMEYSKEAKAWMPTDASAEKLESIFLVIKM